MVLFDGESLAGICDTDAQVPPRPIDSDVWMGSGIFFKFARHSNLQPELRPGSCGMSDATYVRIAGERNGCDVTPAFTEP